MRDDSHVAHTRSRICTSLLARATVNPIHDERVNMNEKKWQGDLPSYTRLAKLMEEVGEVADAYLKVNETFSHDLEHLKEELKHVELMARLWREQLERSVL